MGIAFDVCSNLFHSTEHNGQKKSSVRTAQTDRELILSSLPLHLPLNGKKSLQSGQHRLDYGAFIAYLTENLVRAWFLRLSHASKRRNAKRGFPAQPKSFFPRAVSDPLSCEAS